MGVSILCIWLGMLLLTIVLFRQPYASSGMGMVAAFGYGAGADRDWALGG